MIQHRRGAFARLPIDQDRAGREKTLAFNLSGHVLHTIVGNNLRPGGSPDRPEGDLEAAIAEHFGSFEGATVHADHGCAGLRLGCAGVGTAVAAADRGAGLRPPDHRRSLRREELL